MPGSTDSGTFDEFVESSLPEPQKAGPESFEDSYEVSLAYLKMRYLGVRVKGDHDLKHLQAIHAYLTQNCDVRDSLPRAAETEEKLVRDGRTYRVEYVRASLFGEIEDDLAKSVKDFKAAVAAKDQRGVVEAMTDIHFTLGFAHVQKSFNATTIAAFMLELARDAGINLSVENLETVQRRRDAAIEANPIVFEEVGGQEIRQPTNTDILYVIYDKAAGKRWPQKPELEPEDKDEVARLVDVWPVTETAQSIAMTCFFAADGEERKQRPVFYEKEVYRCLLKKLERREELKPEQASALLSERASWIMGTEMPAREELQKLLVAEELQKRGRGRH